MYTRYKKGDETYPHNISPKVFVWRALRICSPIFTKTGKYLEKIQGPSIA